MSLSINAQKLLSWLTRYNVTPEDYQNYLATRPLVQEHGAFVDALDELLNQATVPTILLQTFVASDSRPEITTAIINVTDIGGSNVTDKGIVWATHTNPTKSDFYTEAEINGDGSGLTGFALISVEWASSYYIRAYATNSTGTGYSEERIFSPGLCLAKGTKVLLSNNTSKNIEDIDYTDTLLVWNFDIGNFDSAKPLWIKRTELASRYNLLKFSDGSELKTISQHRIFNIEKGMFTYPMTEDTPIGTSTFNSNGEVITLISKEIVEESVEHYNIITKTHINLFANGILTSCNFNNIYPIKDMKFVKESRAARPLSEFNVSNGYYEGLRLSEQTFPVSYINAYIKRLEEHKAILLEA